MSLGATKHPALSDTVGIVHRIRPDELVRFRFENKQLVLLFGEQTALILDIVTTRHLQRKLHLAMRCLGALNAKHAKPILWTTKMLEKLKRLTLKGYSHKQLSKAFRCSTTCVVKARRELLGMKRYEQITWTVTK